MQLADHDLEKTVIGSLLLLDDVVQLPLIKKIHSAYFNNDALRNIFYIMTKMSNDGLEITSKSLLAQVKAYGYEYQCGGLQNVEDAINPGIATNKLHEYISRLKEYRLKRELQRIAHKILNGIADHEIPETIAQVASKSIDEMDLSSEESYTLKQCLNEFIEHVKSPQKSKGVTFSWFPESFNYMFPDGLTKGVLMLIQAKSSHGKSTLAAQAAYEMEQKGKNVLYVTCEDGGHIFGMRTAAHLTGLTHKELLSCRHKIDDLFAGVPMLNKDKFIIECNTSNWYEIERLVLQHNMDTPLDMIVIDYLQLLNTGSTSVENRTLDLELIMRSAKTLAMKLQTLIIMVSQEKEDGSAKWASAAYDLADAVFRIKINDYEEFRSGKDKIKVDIVVAKNKVGGGQGSGTVIWNRPIFKFEPVTKKVSNG